MKSDNNSVTLRLHRLIAWLILAPVLSWPQPLQTAAQADQVEPAPAAERRAVAGTPAQMGRQLGRADAEHIRQFIPAVAKLAENLTGEDRKTIRKEAAALAEHLSGEDRALIRHMAEAAGVDFADALAANFIYSLTGEALACRQLVLWGDATVDGRLLHARNLDWTDFPGDPLRRLNRIVHYQPDEGHAYVALTWPGYLGVLTGTNTEGLTVAFNTLLPGRRQREELAEPTFFTLKRVLRTCADIEQAVALIREARPNDNGSIMISHAPSRRAVVVELVEGEVAVRQATGPWIANANHATREAGPEPAWEYDDAAKPFGPLLAGNETPLDVDAVKRLLAHPKVMLQDNIVSVIFTPDRNRMWLACGRYGAAEGPFVELAIFPNDDADGDADGDDPPTEGA